MVGSELVGDGVGLGVGTELVGDGVGLGVGSELVGDGVGLGVGPELVGDGVGLGVGSEPVGDGVGLGVGSELVGDGVGIGSALSWSGLPVFGEVALLVGAREVVEVLHVGAHLVEELRVVRNRDAGGCRELLAACSTR